MTPNRKFVTVIALGLVLFLAACSSRSYDTDAGDDGPTAPEDTTTTASVDPETTADPEPSHGGDPDQGDYSEAIATWLVENVGAGQIDDDQARCLGDHIIDAVGIDRVSELGVAPEEGGDALDLLRGRFDADEANRVYEAFGACDFDLRAALITGLFPDTTVPPDVRDCLTEKLTDDLMRMSLVAEMTGIDVEIDLPGEVGACLPG